MIGMLRTSSKPGVSVGTMIIDARACGVASGSVTAITIANAAPSAPVVNHLWPSMTQSSPSSVAVHDSSVGFEPAFSGSVIEKHERISPRASGMHPLRALRGGAPLVQHLEVAGVGRLAAERVVAERRAAQALADQRVIDQA
jgi:hypothetical protein